jgi:hypothetical protein
VQEENDMSKMKRVGGLETSQDRDYQRRAWTRQWFGWLVIALILLAAIVGLFGSGLLSQTVAG